MIDINKFDDIEDLAIPEEMLGAYLEGNLHGSEFREVNSFILSNPDSVSLIDTVEDDLDFIRDLDLSYQQGIITTNVPEDMFAKIFLPEISIVGMDSIIEISSPLNDDIILASDCYNFVDDDDGHFLHSDSQHNSHQHHDPELDFGLKDNIE